MKKTLLWGGLFILVIAAIAAAVYWESRPQVLVLKNGTKLTLAAVTYGKHHVFKGLKSTGSRQRGRATVDTTNDTVVVWIEAQFKNNQWPNYQLFVSDPDKTGCVSAWQRTGNQVGNGVSVMGFALDAFPRRDRKMILRVAEWDNRGGMQMAKGDFVVANPGPRSFPEWQPESMPDTQSDGDLSATLTKCVLSANGIRFGNMNLPSNDPARKSVQLAFHAEQDGVDASNWQAVAIQTSDATGNHTGMNSWSTSRDQNDNPTLTYQWGLWPEEKAWKLRVEMSRTAGFSNSEIWAVSNVPLKKGNWNDLWNYNNNFPGGNRRAGTNAPVAETTLQGVHLKIYPALRLEDQNFGNGQKQGGFRVSVDPPLPDGYRMSLVEITDENGHKLPPSWGPNNNNDSYVFQLPDIRNAKSLNLTIAVHQSRFLDFTVKPATQ
jgi:hypothetical protein